MKRTPFSVSNGRNHGNSLAAQRAADLALANGTSEGALKGWETRRAGGSSPNNPPSVAEAMGTGGLRNPNVIKRNVDASNGSGPPLLKRHEGGIQYLHADNKTYSNPVHPRSSTWDFPHDAKGMHPTLKERLVKGGAYKNSAQSEELLSNDGTSTKLDVLANGEFVLFKKGQNSPDDIAADESKDKEEDANDAGIDEEKEGEGANKKMANGEFVLFKKGQNSLGDIKDDAKKEPEDKDGKGPDDDKDEDDKKAWVPPWKKDGVENGKACGDSHIPDGHQCHAGEGDVSAGANGEAKMLDSMEKATAAREKARSLTQEARSVFNTNPDVHLRASSAHMAASGHENEAAKHARSNGDTYIAEMQSNKASYHKAMGDAHKKANAEWGGGSKLATARFIDDAQGAAIAYQKGMEMNSSRENDRRRVSNSGNSEGAHEGWLTRRGGVRAGDTFDHESGSGKHVKLTIQGQLDGQKNIELDLPKDVHTAIAAGSWKPNADFEKNSRGEDFHTIHGYEPVTKPGGIREKYGKGSEPDKANGLIGQNVSRAKAYYARARDFGDGTEAQNALKAKAESILKDIHSKHHPALVKAKAAHASSLGNRAYGVLLNSFRGGLLKNYQQDFQEMLDEVADYASNGETLPDDLREQYEEWMDEQN